MRACRPSRALPIRFARPALELLEQRLPPGDLSFIWLMGTPETSDLHPTDDAHPALVAPTKEFAKATDPGLAAAPMTQPQPVSEPIAVATQAPPPVTESPDDLALLAGLFLAPDQGVAPAGGVAPLAPVPSGSSAFADTQSTPTAVATETPPAPDDGVFIPPPGPSDVGSDTEIAAPGGSGGSFFINSLTDDTGVSAQDGITRDNTLTIGGPGTAGLGLDVLVGGELKGSVAVDAQGKWSFDLPRLNDGTHTIEVRGQGGTAGSQSRTVTVAATPPKAKITGHAFAVTLNPTVEVSATGGAPGTMTGVIDVDWNTDGDFDDAEEAGAYQVPVTSTPTAVTLNDMESGNWDLRLGVTDQAGNVGYSPKFLLHVAMDLEGFGHGGAAHGGHDEFGHEGEFDVVPDGPGDLAEPDGGAASPDGDEDGGGGGGVVLGQTSFTETEPNNSQGTGNNVTLPPNDVLVISGDVATADQDWYVFTLGARAGLFLDIDSRETGLSTTLNTTIALFNSGGTQLDSNDNGYDFETGFPGQGANVSATSADSALYRELAAGTYAVRVQGVSNTTGAYQLRIEADTVFSNTVPVFSSNPSAPATIFLDFDGHAATDSWNNNNAYTARAYDFNGTAGEFSPGERRLIQNAWRTLAEDYAPFNVNVTTSYAGAFADKVAVRVVVTNDDAAVVGVNPPTGILGLAFLNSFASGGAANKACWVFTPVFSGYGNFGGGESGRIMGVGAGIGTVAAHEVGHQMGLKHFGGTTPVNVAIMNTAYPTFARQTWFTGQTADTEPPVTSQDDMGVISNTTNGFGYRPDDHGNSTAAATVLTTATAQYTAAGVIAQVASDSDFFRFRATSGGNTTIRANVDEYLNDLNLQLRVFDSSGAAVGGDNSATSFDGAVTLPLGDADYFVEVLSAGAAGEAGQYTIDVTVPMPPPGGPGGDPLPPLVLDGDQFEVNDASEAATNFGAQSSITLTNLTIAKTDGTVDYDWFQFTAAATGTYSFAIQGGRGGPLEMFVHRSDGGFLTPLSSGGASASLDFGIGDVIYVEVRGASTGVGTLAIGEYSLTISS